MVCVVCVVCVVLVGVQNSVCWILALAKNSCIPFTPQERFLVSFLGKFVHWNNSVIIISAGIPITTLLLPIHDRIRTCFRSRRICPVLLTGLATVIVCQMVSKTFPTSASRLPQPLSSVAVILTVSHLRTLIQTTTTRSSLT